MDPRSYVTFSMRPSLPLPRISPPIYCPYALFYILYITYFNIHTRTHTNVSVSRRSSLASCRYTPNTQNSFGPL